MEIAVNRPAKVLSNQLRRLEVELEATDQIDVKRVEIGEQRFEPEPMPLRNAPAEHLATPLVALVMQHDAIVGVGDFDWRCSRRDAIQMRYEGARRVGEVAPNFEDGNEFPVGGERRVERTERVGDPAPLLHWRITWVATMNHVPDERPHHANTFFSRQSSPRCCILNVAMAPTTPADSCNCPGTMRHACTAGLNARRLTSARSGWNNASPA